MPMQIPTLSTALVAAWMKMTLLMMTRAAAKGLWLVTTTLMKMGIFMIVIEYHHGRAMLAEYLVYGWGIIYGLFFMWTLSVNVADFDVDETVGPLSC